MRMSSARAGVANRQAPALQRQTSVLYELQETHEKENLETRNARLMSELSALCSDRNNVLTVESLEFLATDGRAEVVKLEREPEKPLDALPKTTLAGKQEDLLSADAARRQRVEELTRFFMEAKSDIEFALGGSRDFREARDKDKDGESERDDDKDTETGDDDDDAESKADEAADPVRQLARMHARLLRDKIDDRVYNALLSQIRETDPALYGAILCHPLVTGVDPKRDKRKKKKRKDRERKDKSSVSASTSTNAMLSPDLAAPRLPLGEMKLNIARFVARAIADGSIQSLLLATKLLLAWRLEMSESNNAVELTLPLASHLRVLRGEKPPDYPKRETVDAKPVGESTSVEPATPSTPRDGGMTDMSSATIATDISAATMEIETETDSLSSLRARLSHFGEADGDRDDDHEDHEDHDEDDDDDDEEHTGTSMGGEGEGVDEDALMARAIALSLSPEMNREQNDAELSPTAMLSSPTPQATAQDIPPRPDRFSTDEILGLGPFLLPREGIDVDAMTATMCLLAQISQLCLKYLESCRDNILPSSSAVQPHPLTFMLINSVLRDVATGSPSWFKSEEESSAWGLFGACARFSILRTLEAHLFHVEVVSMSPASVGLGQITTHGDVSKASVGNRLVGSVKTLVEQCIHECGHFGVQPSSDRDVAGDLLFSYSWSTSDIQFVTQAYDVQVREYALVSWARAIAHFYPSQTTRHELLVTILQDCLRHVDDCDAQALWKYHQLELLCARLSTPELAQGFVPQCGDVIVSSSHGPDAPQSSTASAPDDTTSVDDATVLGVVQKHEKKTPFWRPEVIRTSLTNGSLTPHCMLEFLNEIGPADALEAAGVSSLVLADSRACDVLGNAYEQLWESSKQQERAALDCTGRLPGLVDQVRESVLHPSWPSFSFREDLQSVHAPLLPNVDRLSKSATSAINARLVFLRSIQDLMIVRVGGARGDEPPALEFDPTRCAETMTLSDGSKTARQYTAKQWGMVMATTGCAPNSGIHEWAVRLDRCEKGHIFLGVCTRDASVATYVGGDRQGWGLIGTRALWHNRSKVRGDYGDGFSTGSVVRVRLNTDTGALSFGLDDSDWGIAFDGLTQHGTLYPAIGLYQRDDQVTILPVRSSDGNQGEAGGVMRRVREVSVPAILHPFLHHCAAIMDSTSRFLSSEAMAQAWTQATASGSSKPVETLIGKHPLIVSLVTPLVSSLSILKNFHGLSSVLALHFIPWCTKLVRQLDQVYQRLRDFRSLKSCDLPMDVSGEWELKSMAAGNIPAQQYHLTLTQDADGVVSGKSSGSFTTVTLNGAVIGTKVRFLETWRQGGTCVVEGRLRADGASFAGCYEDAKSHTSGNIVGHMLQVPMECAELSETSLRKLYVLEIVCANLVGAFSRALMDCERPDLVIEQFTPALSSDDDIMSDGASTEDMDSSLAKVSTECSSDEYEGWVDSLLLSGGLPPSVVQNHLKGVLSNLSDVTRVRLESSSLVELASATNEWFEFVTPKAVSRETTDDATSGLENNFLKDLASGRGEAGAIDRWVSRHVGESPFLRLGGEPMKVAKRTVCAAMLWHSGFFNLIHKIVPHFNEDIGNSEERPHENLMHIWRAAQRVIEWGIRAKNSMGSSYAVVAALVIRKAEFLLTIEPSAKALAASAAVSILSQEGTSGPTPPTRSSVYECAERIYSEVLMQVSRFLEAPIRLSSLQSRMLAHSTRAFLRILGMLSFRFYVGDSSTSTLNRAPSSAQETIQSSFALATTLHWLSPASHASSTPTILKESITSDAMESLPSVTKNDSGHYLSGLGGCGKHLENDIRDAFENLYGLLGASLSKATWAHDSDLQLVILEAWGIVIRPDDHAFLSRVGIFRVLQTVLDEARSHDTLPDSGPTSDRSGSVEERSRSIELRRNVVRATLKVVHLLAAQVAQAGEATDAFAVPADTALSSFSGLAVGAIPLLRKPSGPETLGKSVFQMLYTELKNALEDIRSRTNEQTYRPDATHVQAEPTEVELGPDEFGDKPPSDTSESEEYCYQICSLLYSVSGSPVCRSHLSSSRWLRLLLVLLELGSVSIQRRALKLLRRILPELDPAAIKLRPDAMDVFDVDSDDEGEDDDTQDQATSLINFFVGIVRSMCPPSLVEAMLQRLPGNADGIRSPGDGNANGTSGLAGEVVLLLRSLYESSKWSSHLSVALVAALSGLPVGRSSIGSTESREALDADVEMEDTSGRELPSLDSWVVQSQAQLNALAALCVLDGHVESLRVGATVKILPKTSSVIQEVSFRGASGVVISYEPDKSAAEVLVKSSRSSESSSSRSSSTIPNRPIRIPVDDLVPVPDIELDASVFSDDVLQTLLVNKFPFFIDEINRSHESLKLIEGFNKVGDAYMDEPDEDDDMSNDGSSSPSGMDSEMAGGGGAESDDGEDEVTSPRSRPVVLDGEIEAGQVFSEMDKESQLHRMLLCQHGLRSISMLLRDKRAAEIFIRGGGSGNLFDLLQIAISETPTAGLVETASLEESWVYLWSRWSNLRRAAACPVPKKTAEKKEGEGSADADAPPNPMVQQMMEMGFPKEWCEVALAKCSQNVEAAINFCFEHSSDMERMVTQFKAAKEASTSAESSRTGRGDADAINPLLEQLAEMGFPQNWCKKALVANRNNVDAALTWILSNGEALEAEDRREEEAKQHAIDGTVDAPVVDVPAVIDLPKPNPLRAVSGQASIGENDLMVEGLVGAGFPSVGAPDCVVTSGRWYYEATLLTNGCIQIGWADVAFSGAADRGDGVGDGVHSWAYDGWRQQKWHCQSSPWGSKWKQGDVVGCAVDVDAGSILFSLNGKMKSANMGIAFRGVQFAHGLYPCASFNRRERLQFNMGGSPFKHTPPPGFRPILEVLCREGETIADLPKGFAVIGRREDCLEEAIGEENYSSESRYFGRELLSSMARSSGGHHSRGTILSTSNRAEMIAELKAIPDDRVYNELLLLSRSIAVLHARRALLTILSKWPKERVGDFSMDCFAEPLSSSKGPSPRNATLFIDFVKLIASCSGGGGGVPGSTRVDSMDVDEQLDSCSSGRQALGLLLGVMRTAIDASLSKSLTSRDKLLDAVLDRITVEVKTASERVYARVPWDANDASITASFLQLSSESGQSWSDKEVLKHPNVFLAEWFSRLLMDSLANYEDRVDENVRNSLRIELLKAWLAAFKSPGLCVKEKAFGIIGGILHDTLLKAAATEGTLSPASAHELVQRVLHALPLNRLLDLADERLLKEYPQLPVCSRYLQAILELVSSGSLASTILGQPADALFHQDVSGRLDASRRLEADLFDIDAKEYEEELEKRRLMAEEAAAKAAEEKAAAIAAEAAAVTAAATAAPSTADATSGAVTDPSTAETTDGDQQMQEAENALPHADNTTGTSMEVDSDSDENPDITLSAIANMVAEDSDVEAAAAAIAAAAKGRLTVKHAGQVDEEKPPVAPREFNFCFPEQKIDFDTTLLDAVEKRLLEAGEQGLLGDEPMAWHYGSELGLLSDTTAAIWSGQLTQFRLVDAKEGQPKLPELTVGCRVIRGPNWKWRDQDGGEGSIGVVEGVSPWSGVEGEGMSVRWPNDSLYTYRWGADGNYDLVHVEVDEEGKTTKTYPTPQVKLDDEGAFGCEVHLGVLLHLFDEGPTTVNGTAATKLSGVMEWPDYGAAVRVVGVKNADSSLVVQELQMIRGHPDMGWTLRFGCEKWQPGTKYTLKPDAATHGETLCGEFSNMARRGGKLVEVKGELRVSTKSLFTMDAHCHFSTLTISDEGMTVTCNSGESRNLALGTVGFATGVHYWEVRVDQAEFGSVFIGVCEKAGPPGSQAALANRLNRWTGWGFVNFRATYHNSTERIYGDHFNAGDTIGVCLDMEQGKLSFFMDGMKFGEHIVADLGAAFDNMKGEKNMRTLYPCIGMRKSGDRVALNGKWVSVPGVSSKQLLRDTLDVSSSLHAWYLSAHASHPGPVKLSDRLLQESWLEWRRWHENRWQRYPVRPRGVLADFDTYPSSCIRLSNAARLSAPFLAGDRVRISSTYGRELTQPEEAVILGVYRGQLWYRTETQGNEGSDEGRAWAWYFSPSELAELLLLRRNGKDMTLMENSATDVDESLAVEASFSPQSDLEAQAHISYEAFVRLATDSHTPATDMQLVERLNTFCAACGVDITNLRIGDVLTPDEAQADASRPVDEAKARRAHVFIPDQYFSSPALKTISGPELRARCAVLRVFNSKVTRALPLIALQPSEAVKDVIDVAAKPRAGVATLTSSADYPSTSVKLRSLRRLIFTSTKRSFWDAVLRATTTSTPLPSDEYEDPREIRTIRINRIQAQASKLSLLAQPSDRLRRSVFGQLYREMRTWNDSSFRRSYCGKGHGGQRRAFKVKFLGEGVNDYGGPYRAVFEQVVDELQMDSVELSKGEEGLLPLLIPCPNRRSGTGSNQDKFLLNPSCGTSVASNGPMALDLHRFLGKIIGTAVRHGLQMGLDLPSLVWRPLAGLEVSRANLESVDLVATNSLSRVEQADEPTAQETFEYLTFTTTLSDGSEAMLCPNGDKLAVTLENRTVYVELVEKKRLTESQQQLSALRDGLSSVLPMELAPLFTPRELEVLICGRREVDVELLRQCTEYGESVDESMAHVQAFWEVLKEMSSDERTEFLRFVWARSRMPNSAKDFPMNFKIQTAHDSGAQVDPDKYLPHAQTCFFALRLPIYTSKAKLREKLLYAIQNSPNMDADVRLHNAEGWADA